MDRQFAIGNNLVLFTLPSEIKVQGVGGHTSPSREYALPEFYLPGTYLGEQAIAHFTREVHLVDSLEPKVLIWMDIIGGEDITISPSLELAEIGSCLGTKVPLAIHNRTSPKVLQRAYTLSAIVIPPNSAQVVPFRTRTLPKTRDFLFLPGNENHGSALGSISPHVVDHSTNGVPVANRTDGFLKISKGTEIGNITEMDVEHHLFDTVDTAFTTPDDNNNHRTSRHPTPDVTDNHRTSY
jgi:hypothetical protein